MREIRHEALAEVARFGGAALIAWLAMLAVVGIASPARGQAEGQALVDQVSAPLPDPIESDGSWRPISEFLIEYERPVAGQPPARQVLQARVALLRTALGWVAPREGAEGEEIVLGELEATGEGRFFDSALPLITPAVVRRLQELGLMGVYVEPHREQVQVQGGRIVDLRAEGETSLTLRITTGIVVEMRTNGLGERLGPNETLNHPAHARVLRFSPVVPVGPDGAPPAGATSLLRRDLLDRYVHHLNRHPGRRIDLAIVPGGEEFGGVTLDYLVTENRPWLFFAQLSNTGTESTTDLRERFGFIHNQLTNADDTLSIDYLTGDFDEVHAFTGTYDRPIGLDGRLRGRVFGSWYTYTSAEVGLADADFDGDGYSLGGELRWNFYQHEDLFVDLTAGLRWERAEVDNNFIGTEGEGDFLLPSIGARVERVRVGERLLAGARVEGNVLDIDQEDLDNLGRFDADEHWAALIVDGFYSFYLEPLIGGDPNEPTALAHEIALSGRLHWAFDARLPPNFQQVLGGLYSVRGYPEAAVAGDTMVLASVEYRYHVPQGLSPKAQPGRFFGLPFRYAPQYTSGPTDWDFVLKAFVDVGRVLQSDREFFEEHSTLIGAGVGLETVLTRRLTGRVDFAWAIEGIDDAGGGTEVDSGDFEIHFVVTAIF